MWREVDKYVIKLNKFAEEDLEKDGRSVASFLVDHGLMLTIKNKFPLTL